MVCLWQNLVKMTSMALCRCFDDIIPIKLDMTPLATWKNDLWTGGSWFRVNSRGSHCGTLWGPICLHRTTEHQQQTLNFGPQTQPIFTPHVFAQAFLDSQVEIRLQQISWEWLVQSKWSQRQLVIRIVLATVCCRLGSWGLVIKLNFCSDFEHFCLAKLFFFFPGKCP